MELRIFDDKGFVDQGFGQWLIPRIKTYIVASISKYNLKQVEEFLNSSEDLPKLYSKKYSLKNLIIFASNNLKCVGTDGEISIQFDSNVKVPGFDRLKLDVLVKTINYGTLSVKGLNIFTDAFNKFASEIDTYVGLYYLL